MTENKISAVENLESLLQMDLKIPEYQRPYRWTIEQVKNLLSDVLENKKDGNGVPYMIGTIILHKDINERMNIVDGQQRLTTLTLLLYALGKKDGISLLNESFSTDTITTNYKYIHYYLNKYEIDKEEFRKYILSQVTFVIITTTEIDEAFVFFDSQNSRGKSLERKDLLKAHHLRYVENNEIATESAKEWEALDKKRKLSYLIDNILGRARQRIRKEKNAISIDVLQEFKAQRVSKKKDSFYKLSKYHQPPIFDLWWYNGGEKHGDDAGLELIFRDIDAMQGTKRLKFVNDSKKFLPLQLMQPLEGGEQFFWYVQKYNILLNEELFNEKFEPRILPESVTGLYKIINEAANRNVGMYYIKEVFEAVLLFYYDKFGTDDIEKFGLWLEHGLAYLRYRQASLQYATIRKFIFDEFNPYAIINEAAFPENCIYQINDFTRGKFKDDRINTEKGIRNWYHRKIYDFVSENVSLFKNIGLQDKNRFDIWQQK